MAQPLETEPLLPAACAMGVPARTWVRMAAAAASLEVSTSVMQVVARDALWAAK